MRRGPWQAASRGHSVVVNAESASGGGFHHSYADRLRPLGRVFDNEAHLLALLQIAIALPLDSAEVNEDLFASFIGCDEAVALHPAEPLDGSRVARAFPFHAAKPPVPGPGRCPHPTKKSVRSPIGENGQLQAVQDNPECMGVVRIPQVPDHVNAGPTIGAFPPLRNAPGPADTVRIRRASLASGALDCVRA